MLVIHFGMLVISLEMLAITLDMLEITLDMLEITFDMLEISLDMLEISLDMRKRYICLCMVRYGPDMVPNRWPMCPKWRLHGSQMAPKWLRNR